MTAPAATTPTPVAAHVARLNALAQTDARAAQDAVWAWFARLGDGLPGEDAQTELAQLFASGTAAEIDGSTEGLLIGWTTPPADLGTTGRIVRFLGAATTRRLGVMPWLGKKFDNSAGRGTNMLPRSAVVLTALLAPTYRMRKMDGHWEGFDMLNRRESSTISPATKVLVLDYESVGTNPWPINRVRDEAVQIVPGTYLGAKLFHQADGYQLLAYWAAKTSGVC